MSVISITITESVAQKLAGIPVTVTLTTNVPATIFYTLDGTNPTTSSSVVTGPIKLPTNQSFVVLKAFATDGVTTCPIIEEEYGSSFVDTRRPHDTVSGLNDVSIGARYPFGSQDSGGPGIYGNTGGIIVDAPNIPGIPDALNADGSVSNETDKPLNEYDLLFSETNAIGERGVGIGNFYEVYKGTAKTTVVVPDPILETSIGEGSPHVSSPLFNPRSLVIFQDDREEPYDPESSTLMRQNFSLENTERARDGRLTHTTAYEGNITRGGFLRSHFNARDNTHTYYYRDADTNRWIISKVQMTQRTPDIFNYSKIVFGRERGAGKVFKWIPFRHRRLT